MNEELDGVSREVTIAAPILDVWRLITEPEHVQAWYAFDGATVELREGGCIEHYWHEHGRFRGRITQLAAPTLLSYWYSNVPDLEPAPGTRTLVTFELTAVDGGHTALRVTESGIRGLTLTDEERASYLAVTTQGWAGGLRALVERATSMTGS